MSPSPGPRRPPPPPLYPPHLPADSRGSQLVMRRLSVLSSRALGPVSACWRRFRVVAGEAAGVRGAPRAARWRLGAGRWRPAPASCPPGGWGAPQTSSTSAVCWTDESTAAAGISRLECEARPQHSLQCVIACIRAQSSIRRVRHMRRYLNEMITGCDCWILRLRFSRREGSIDQRTVQQVATLVGLAVHPARHGGAACIVACTGVMCGAAIVASGQWHLLDADNVTPDEHMSNHGFEQRYCICRTY